MIARIGTALAHGWRHAVACYLREAAHRLDHESIIILATDDEKLVRLCIQGCSQMFVQKQMQEMQATHQEICLRMALENWRPDVEQVQ